MTSPRIAVVAHSGKTLGGGLSELRRVLERGCHADQLVRGPQEQVRAQAGREGDQGRRRPDLRVGRRRDGATLRRRARRLVRARSRSCRPARPTSWRPNLGIPKDLEQAVDIGLAGAHRRLDVGPINGERFAVMAGAGFDARMLRDADGSLKDRFGRLAYVWTGAKHLATSRSRRRSRSTAHAGSTARRAASSSATWASSSAASRRSRMPGPTTACSKSASSPPMAHVNGCRPSRARSSARIQGVTGAHDQGALGAHQAQQEGALRARRRRPQEGQPSCGSMSSRGRSRSACPWRRRRRDALARCQRAHAVEQARARLRPARGDRHARTCERVGEADLELRARRVDHSERDRLVLVELAQGRDAALAGSPRGSPRRRCARGAADGWGRVAWSR